jgi:serine/threonine-protein kinase
MSRREGRLATKEALVPRLKVNDELEPPPGFLGNGRRTAISAAIGVVLVLAVVFTGIWYFTGGPGSYIRTPSVSGLPVVDAQRAIVLKGLTAGVDKQFSSTVSDGTVISSNPGGGEKVKKNGTVTLVVSKGPELVAVPNLKGKTLADATAALKAVGLAVGDTQQKYNADVAEGQIISSTPTAGTKVSPDRKVKLVISKGFQPVPLDNVVGQNFDQAKALLESKGLKVSQQEQDFQDGGPAAGTVVAQDPAASGQQVAKGSTVTLTSIKQPPQVNAPDVRGQDIDQAKATLEALGFQVDAQSFNPFSKKVQEQDIIGPAAQGSKITIKAW